MGFIYLREKIIFLQVHIADTYVVKFHIRKNNDQVGKQQNLILKKT